MPPVSSRPWPNSPAGPGCSTPALYRVPSRLPNAFALGSPEDSAICVTDGLLDLLDGRELAAVLAHEIGHIANRDLWIMSLADMMSRLVSLASWLGQLLLLLNLPLVLAGFVHGDLACRDSPSRSPSWRWSNSAFRARASKTPTAPQQI